MPASIGLRGSQLASGGSSAAPVTSNIDNSLSATDILNFETQRQSARTSAQRALTRNSFDRGVLNLQNRRSIRSANRDFGFAQERVPEQFARRGILRSGLQRRQANLLAEENQLSLDEMAFQLQNQLGLLDLDDQNIESLLAETLSSVDAQELARRALLASEV